MLDGIFERPGMSVHMRRKQNLVQTDLEADVTGEEEGYTGLVLDRSQAEVLVNPRQLGLATPNTEPETSGLSWHRVYRLESQNSPQRCSGDPGNSKYLKSVVTLDLGRQEPRSILPT
jgi:hypothetical protein